MVIVRTPETSNDFLVYQKSFLNTDGYSSPGDRPWWLLPENFPKN
jgi:hypothetical protein